MLQILLIAFAGLGLAAFLGAVIAPRGAHAAEEREAFFRAIADAAMG